MTQELLRQVDQSVWANRAWTEFVYARPEPEARPLELLGHLMISEQVWFDRIEGRKESEVMFPVLEKAELLRGFDENAGTYRHLIAGRLEDVVAFRRITGEEYHARVFDIVHHLLTHGYHHRGQLAAIYGRMGGVKYPNTDHINFLIVNRL
jgi:uncharacterized damage-inducible protein DinB